MRFARRARDAALTRASIRPRDGHHRAHVHGSLRRRLRREVQGVGRERERERVGGVVGGASALELRAIIDDERLGTRVRERGRGVPVERLSVWTWV